VRTLHAEQNAIIQAARFGIPLEGATLFCKMTPCRTCAMMIINAGIKRVVCEKHYHADGDTIELFGQAGVELVVMKEEVEEYDQQ
jgi:dCMP deaminase